MTFSIMGFRPGEDGLVFEQEINLYVTDLIPVMSWKDSPDCIGADYHLSATQVREIEHLASIELPKDLDLYLTSYS